tara:strand:- start:370 stop:558 length:189 start_codon:yes stop_codon:yes gene_type:complete
MAMLPVRAVLNYAFYIDYAESTPSEMPVSARKKLTPILKIFAKTGVSANILPLLSVLKRGSD